MKKLRYIFSFLNKKGVFFFGLVLGIVFSLFVSYSVFADEVTLPGDVIQICYIPDGYELYVHASDFDITKMAWGKNNGSDFSWIYVGPNLSEVYYRNSPTDSWKVYKNMSNLSDTPYTTVPITCGSLYVFNSVSEAQAYVNGKIDASSAVNYEEVQNNNLTFDSSIPSLDYAYLQQISETQNIVNFGYNETIPPDVVKYKITVYNYYVQDTTIYDLAFTLVGAQVKRFDKFYENGLLRTDLRTVQERMQEVTILTDMEFFMDEEQKTFVDTMYLQNVVKLPDYNTFDKFQYFACRVEIVPVTSDGRYGNKVIVSGTISDVHNSLMGTNFVKESSDSTGQVIQSTPQGVTNTGEFTSSGLNTDNLLSYFQNGFGLLGNNGFLALARETFNFFPAEIWVLIFFGISVSIVLIVARFGRGL